MGHGMSNLQKVRLGLLSGAILAVVCCVFAAQAIGAPYGRSLATELTQFPQPEAVDVTSDDHVLVGDIETGLVSELPPYPSHEVVKTDAGAGYWGGNTYVHSLAKSAATDFLYVGTEGPELPGGGSCSSNPFVTIDNFDQIFNAYNPSCQTWVAVDNAPESDSYGDYYLYVLGKIEKFDGYGHPVPFTGSASYISAATR